MKKRKKKADFDSKFAVSVAFRPGDSEFNRTD